MTQEKEVTETGALHQIAKTLERLAQQSVGTIELKPGHAGPASNCFELAATEGPYEHVLICRSLGTATIYRDDPKLFIVPNGQLHRLDCEHVGDYVGVFQSTVDSDLFTFPQDPTAPFDKPSDIPDFRLNLHPTKAIWNFKGGNSVRAVGPANSYVIPLNDNTAQLVISIAMVITGGTGIYDGARGTISSLGATWFPYVPGGDLKSSLKAGAVFEAKGVHGFRITLKGDRKP
jgi:hypothetical protein